MTWTDNEALYQHFKTWKHRCELILEAQLAHITETQKVKSVLQWSGENGLEIFNTSDLDIEAVTLTKVFNRWEDFCKPQANDLKTRFDLHQV